MNQYEQNLNIKNILKKEYITISLMTKLNIRSIIALNQHLK